MQYIYTWKHLCKLRKHLCNYIYTIESIDANSENIYSSTIRNMYACSEHIYASTIENIQFSKFRKYLSFLPFSVSSFILSFLFLTFVSLSIPLAHHSFYLLYGPFLLSFFLIPTISFFVHSIHPSLSSPILPSLLHYLLPCFLSLFLSLPLSSHALRSLPK